MYGGWSEEKEISRRTGEAVLDGLRQMGLNAFGISVDQTLPQKMRKLKVGYCFIALHGKLGEDGTIQGLCEIMGIPHSGSGVLASALSMHKGVSKKIFESYGIPTPDFTIVDSADIDRQTVSFPVPCVVKPADGGSAIGVNIVKKKSDLKRALRNSAKYSSQVLIEKWVKGTEVTASVLGTEVLPLIEIIPKTSFYDFRAKYEKGMSDHIIPAGISPSAANCVRDTALKVHRALRCRGFSRVDFIVDNSDKPWVLELNSIPGMTQTSLFPEAARAAGLSFSEMLLEIIRSSFLQRCV